MTKTTVQQLQHRVAFCQDEAAYKQLFLFYYPSMIAFARRQAACSEDAEDLIAEVMLKLWTMGEKLAGIENLTIYLYTALRNRALNMLAKKSPLRYSLPVEESAGFLQCLSHTPEERMVWCEEKRYLQKAIAALPEKCQAVYRLVREEGLSYKKVAAILQISENTVDRHLNNALHKLVAALSVYFDRKQPSQKKAAKGVGSWEQQPVLAVLPTIAAVWKGSCT